MNYPKNLWTSAAGLALLLALLASCSRPSARPAASPSPAPGTAAAASPSAASSPTPALPSPTPEPLAAQVGPDGVSLAAYQAELGRYQQAAGRELASEDQQKVLDDLVDQVLLAQAAGEQGFQLDAAALDARVADLAAALGGTEALAAWMSANGYTAASFRQDLQRQAAAAWMRDQIAAGVPEAAEQVHARQILASAREDAEALQAELQAGSNFDVLAARQDPVAEGDLGWFPRGVLLDSGLEEAIFALQPGQVTGIVQTAAGFHLVELVERDPQRSLEPAARLAWQQKAVRDWLEQRRAQTTIEILSP